MFTRSFTLLLFLIGSLTVMAQNIRLTGKVVNDKNEPLTGVSVSAGGAGTTTDVDGNYTLSLTPGKKYELTFSAVGYAVKKISETEVASGASNVLNITLSVAARDLSAVTVTAARSARRESVNSLIQFQKNTNTVAQVVSAELIRRSPDRSTGEVLKRVPGTSVQDGKYLIVRGLSDRYNQAMLNGILLTSTEADRKTFSFDLFPAAVIDNIIINKAFVPELPGEWAGGLVQVNTKDIPAKGFFQVQAGIGGNTQTMGKDFYRYKGGKYDWLGFDDGSRGLPSSFPLKGQFNSQNTTVADRIAYGNSLQNVWSAEGGNAPVNTSFQVNGGFNTRVLGKKAGGVLALTYSRSNRNVDFQNSFYNINDGKADSSFRYQNNRYAQDVLWGALGNLSIQLANNHKISIKNLFNVNASDYATLRTGRDYERGPDQPENVRARELGFRSTIYNNSQLIGEHSFAAGRLRAKWYGGFTILDQYTPDQRRIQYNQAIGVQNAPYILLTSDNISQKSGSRFFSNLNDYIYNGGADLSGTVNAFGYKQTIKAGYALQVRDRLFDSRPFAAYLYKSDASNLGMLTQDESTIFSPENFDASDDYKFKFGELTSNRFRYMANTILNAGYLQFDNQFSEAIRLVWGARLEHFDQVVGSMHTKDDRHVHNSVLDVLPGVNLTLKVNDHTNVRLSGSQTVIRPELRELASFAFFDFELGATVLGNPNLQRTKVTNADLRYELYPRAGEMFTAGVFYKRFKNPIELYFNQSGAGTSNTFNYVNAARATGFGLEVEGRKKLDFTPSLERFTLSGNLSYIFNKVQDEEFNIDRPMQGQSPYVVNLALQYDIQKAGLNTTLLFNQIGRRIIYVGNDQIPAIWENPRPVLDLQLAKKLLNNKAEVKLNVSDALNRRAYFYHDLDNSKSFQTSKDAIAINRKYGTSFSLGFTYNIK
ncbi:carboxypeptidase regulatory-like domain-containing protein [Paraflavisolibacter sp. H34]|uniref:TonB-dependent receptor n=1 Tax=Huijunlia imazamoxiresistens TaxID=3127457 RepID=UPI003015C43C